MEQPRHEDSENRSMIRFLQFLKDGCGVFKLDPQKVADCFNTEIKKGYYSGHIQFNLPDPTIFDIFLKTIL